MAASATSGMGTHETQFSWPPPRPPLPRRTVTMSQAICLPDTLQEGRLTPALFEAVLGACGWREQIHGLGYRHGTCLSLCLTVSCSCSGVVAEKVAPPSQSLILLPPLP